MKDLIACRGLTKVYGGKAALDGVDLSVGPGRIVGLLGPNGSGKTTLIKLAAGLLTPTAGTITVCGENIGTGSKALVSYLPDRTYFSRQQKIRELLDLFQDFYPDFDRVRATCWMSPSAAWTRQPGTTFSTPSSPTMTPPPRW